MENDKSMKRKTKKPLLITILIIIVVFSLAIWGISHYLSVKAEHELEMADLQAMRIAESVAMMKYKDKMPERATAYWFDAKSNSLIPASEPMPEPYGMGNELDGDAYEDFLDETGEQHEYKEQTDYSNKVIKLTAEKGSDGKLKTTVKWVDYKK